MFEDSVKVEPALRFPELASAIAALPVRPERGGTAAQSAADTRALLELSRQLQARLHAHVACLDEQGFALALGSASTTAWLAAYANLDRSQARRMVMAARTADRLPLLGARHAAGAIGVEHLSAVASGAPALPDEVLLAADKTFADFSGSARPAELKAVAQRLKAVHDQRSADDDEAWVHDSRRLSLARTFGDAWHLEGVLEPVDGAALDVALQSLMGRRGDDDNRTVTQRRADALVELAQLGLSSAQLPDCGGDRPRLAFVIDVGSVAAGSSASASAALRDVAGAVTGLGPGAAVGTHPGGVGGSGLAVSGFGDGVMDASRALIGLDGWLAAETLARISCDADRNVVLVDGDGDVLAYGRTRRDPSPAQRRAVVVRDRHCVFPGCDVAPVRCQVHPLRYWSRDGRTDLDNLALICLFHHRTLHEDGWRLRRDRPQGRAGPVVWVATAPDGHELRQDRRPAA